MLAITIDTSICPVMEYFEIFLTRMVPVSYTHLDVYKRQQICKELTGQDNQNALQLLDYCEQNKKPVWIRHAVIPGITALPERLEALAEHLADKSCIQRVELLPFHQMGKYKWKALNLFYPLADTPEPTEKEMADVQKIFLKYHLPLVV